MSKESQYKRVKRMLEEAGSEGVTNTTFYRAYLPNFRNRICEMRHDGINISTEFVRVGQFRYTLIPQRKPVTEVKPFTERLQTKLGLQ